jgi:ribosomal 50S subunit-recycling heat shock protein
MRVDQYLSEVCLIKTRNIAKKACDQDLVKINGKIAKAHTLVKPEDVVEYCLFNQRTTVRIVGIPSGNVAKKTAGQFYEIQGREALPQE